LQQKYNNLSNPATKNKKSRTKCPALSAFEELIYKFNRSKKPIPRNSIATPILMNKGSKKLSLVNVGSVRSSGLIYCQKKPKSKEPKKFGA
jgi:hypothetical protein